jgi:DNA-binding transcriptional ArsR family regulator
MGAATPTPVEYFNVLQWHGCQDRLIDFLDERLAKAFSHRLRLRILERLSEHGVASPSELADALGEPLGNGSYHAQSSSVEGALRARVLPSPAKRAKRFGRRRRERRLIVDIADAASS